jgi:glycosyltransferase involved in cell wall biosynthesis
VSNQNVKNTASVGIVVIGRNEGERLKTCLESVQKFGFPIAYVDSGSTDQSVQLAGQYVSCVHQLDRSSPFSAARARNEGFDVLTQQFPDLKYIQFVDGDCVVAPAWFDGALAAFNQDAELALVLGHRKELKPELTIYNRLAAMEWNSPVGELTNFGCLIGSFLIKVDVFRAMHGFKTNVIAGEDSELGVRMCLAGYKMQKIDQHMETHDANMLKFSQWWNRAVRAGHAIGQRAFINGDTAVKDCVKERKSTLIWGIGMPIIWLLLLIIKPILSVIILLLYGVLTLKVYLYSLKLGMNLKDAMTYTVFIVMGKIANGVGLLKFYMNTLKKQYVLIEYK